MNLIRLLLSKLSKKETNLDVKNTINDLASLVVELTKGKRSDSIGSNSVYIKTNDRVIRISDHTSTTSRSVNVLVTNEVIKIKCIKAEFICRDINTAANKITSLISVFDVLNSYYGNITTLRQENKVLRDKLQSLKGLSDLNTKLTNSINSNKQLRDQLSKLRKETKLVSHDSEQKSIQITTLEKEIKKISKECIEYKALAKEGKEIIQNLLCNPDVGRAMFTDGEHKFYLDHFPIDAQELLKDIIKEYYNK